jgi:hypothetical protein
MLFGKAKPVPFEQKQHALDIVSDAMIPNQT